jgi:hypothetical protein
MSKWFRWWKSDFFLMLLVAVILIKVVAFLLAYFIEWGWILAILVAVGGGFILRKMVIKKLDEWSE